MGRKSKIDKLPQETKKKIVKEYAQGKTLREIALSLSEEGYNVNHENIRRWIKKHRGTVDLLSVMGEELEEGYLINALKSLTVMALGLQSQLQYVMEKISSQNITPQNLEKHISLINDLISNISRLTTAIRNSERTLMELGKAFKDTIDQILSIITQEIKDPDLRDRLLERIKDELQNQGA